MQTARALFVLAAIAATAYAGKLRTDAATVLNVSQPVAKDSKDATVAPTPTPVATPVAPPTSSSQSAFARLYCACTWRRVLPVILFLVVFACLLTVVCCHLQQEGQFREERKAELQQEPRPQALQPPAPTTYAAPTMKAVKQEPRMPAAPMTYQYAAPSVRVEQAQQVQPSVEYVQRTYAAPVEYVQQTYAAPVTYAAPATEYVQPRSGPLSYAAPVVTSPVTTVQEVLTTSPRMHPVTTATSPVREIVGPVRATSPVRDMMAPVPATREIFTTSPRMQPVVTSSTFTLQEGLQPVSMSQQVMTSTSQVRSASPVREAVAPASAI